MKLNIVVMKERGDFNRKTLFVIALLHSLQCSLKSSICIRSEVGNKAQLLKIKINVEMGTELCDIQ